MTESYALRLPKNEFSPEFFEWAKEKQHIVHAVHGDISWVNGFASNGFKKEWVLDVLDDLESQFHIDRLAMSQASQNSHSTDLFVPE